MANIDAYVSAVLREYLSRRGLKTTLASFDAEAPRVPEGQAVTTRSALAKGLGLERIVKKNKQREAPLASMLEMLIDYQLSKAQEKTSGDKKASATTLSAPPSKSRSTSASSTASRDSSAVSRSKSKTASASSSLEEFTHVARPSSRSSASAVAKRSRDLLRSKDYDSDARSATPTPEVADDMAMEDFDEDLGMSMTPKKGAGLSGRLAKRAKPVPITAEQAKELRLLFFGRMTSFTPEWLQGFYFSDVPKLRYGLVQQKGGPCGVLAAVQAHILNQLLYVLPKEDGRDPLDPSDQHRKIALVHALAQILWTIGENRVAKVCLTGGVPPSSFDADYKPDKVTETLLIHDFLTLEDTTEFLLAHLGQFAKPSGYGIVLLVYSAMLTRGLYTIRDDMDSPEGQLMGAHFYCSMDLVNLLLVGVARSNLHDGDIDAGGMTLHGIDKQAPVGMLTLFEHYDSLRVGANYKNPKSPIWVICCESHFTTAFSPDGKAKNPANKNFDLIFYDELANQDEEYRLTLDTSSPDKVVTREEDIISPIEHTLRTKWPSAKIDWNGSEPLL